MRPQVINQANEHIPVQYIIPTNHMTLRSYLGKGSQYSVNNISAHDTVWRGLQWPSGLAGLAHNHRLSPLCGFY